MTVRLKAEDWDREQELRDGTLYQIQPNGVLTIVLKRAVGGNRILREFSPSGWHSVSGDRYRGGTSAMAEIDSDDESLFDDYDVTESFQ
jgi:hypothetical protein